MKVVFRPAARNDLERIHEWIAKDNPRAAVEMIRRIEGKLMLLTSPALARVGRPGLVDCTRELIEGSYIVVYKIDEARGQIIVLAVVHGACDRDGREADRSDR